MEVYILIKEYIDYKEPLAYYKIAELLYKYIDKDTTIVCIGTDKCIGDSLGPIVGSILKEMNLPIPVYGTLEDPIHALNLKEKLSEINKLHETNNIIGIDACLGNEEDIGNIIIRDHPIYPGKGVGKSLPEVGNISIVGIVDSSKKSELFSNRNIRLSFIVNMCKTLCHGIVHSYYLYSLISYTP